MPRAEAVRLAYRVARDSVPPLRLPVLLDVSAHPDTTLSDVRRRLDKPRATIDRQLQALHALEVLACREGSSDGRGTAWHYTLAESIDANAIKSLRADVPETADRESKEGPSSRFNSPNSLSAKSGTYENDEREGMAS
jgi:hypothetical protein